VRAVEDLLDDAVVEQDGIGYPSVAGTYRGESVKLELLVDTLTPRRLPRLWLVVTIRRPLPVQVPVDVILAPVPTDIASPGVTFRYEHERPAHWPEHIRIATREPFRMTELYDVDALTDVLHDPLTKSVVLAPGGVRVVHELARGEVASYRVVRRPNFSFDLSAADARAVLDAALGVADGVGSVYRRAPEAA
jgi:hypothetical protein